LGQHEDAAVSFGNSIQCDNYLSVAYFQQGVSLYILQDFEQALTAFDNSFLYFRGTNAIDYTQLGLDYKLFSCEVLYNRALTLFQLGDENAALQDLGQASKAKQIPEHEIINEAIQYRGDGCQLFQVPANLLYKPPKQKLANAAKIDYLGRSKVVAATDPSDNFTEFKGARGVRQEPEPDFAPIRTLDRKNSLPAQPPRIDTGMARRPSAPGVMMSPTSAPARRGSPMDSAPRVDRSFPQSATIERNGKSSGRGPPPMPQRVQSPYPESEYGGGTFSRAGSIAAGKLRVKVNFGDKRMLMLPADATFDELCDKIVEKFGTSKFRVMFKDEDGELVSMTDDDDFLLCRSISMDENKIEVWCQ
ncbi:hypothetical protein BCR44DRAFT_1426825, partial [Catenaria anguillulae PL171]